VGVRKKKKSGKKMQKGEKVPLPGPPGEEEGGPSIFMGEGGVQRGTIPEEPGKKSVLLACGHRDCESEKGRHARSHRICSLKTRAARRRRRRGGKNIFVSGEEGKFWAKRHKTCL